jgi:hypothetical protein
MSEEKNSPPDATPPSVAPKPPKKLQPRVAPKPEVAATTDAAAAVPKAPVAKKPVVKKPSRLDETKARNKKALAEALAKAQAVQIVPPSGTPSLPDLPKAAKPAKPVKPKKIKLVRHSFSMPETEYAQIALLKKRIADFGGKARRSELVRAGIAALAAMDNVELTALMARVERIKPGRPAK